MWPLRSALRPVQGRALAHLLRRQGHEPTRHNDLRGAIAMSLLLMSSNACDLLVSRDCTAEFVYGLTAGVFHSQTGVQITDESLAGTLEQGGYSETMERRGGHQLVGAGERAGTYTMRVTADGFEPWTRSGIDVEADACHVIPVEIDVRLIPSGPM